MKSCYPPQMKCPVSRVHPCAVARNLQQNRIRIHVLGLQQPAVGRCTIDLQLSKEDRAGKSQASLHGSIIKLNGFNCLITRRQQVFELKDILIFLGCKLNINTLDAFLMSRRCSFLVYQQLRVMANASRNPCKVKSLLANKCPCPVVG
jgi:hypothetical protein